MSSIVGMGSWFRAHKPTKASKPPILLQVPVRGRPIRLSREYSRRNTVLLEETFLQRVAKRVVYLLCVSSSCIQHLSG